MQKINWLGHISVGQCTIVILFCNLYLKRIILHNFPMQIDENEYKCNYLTRRNSI